MKCMQSSTNSLLSNFSLFNLQDVVSNKEDGNKIHRVNDCDDMDSDGNVSNEINDTFDRLEKFCPSLKITNIQPLDVVSNPIGVLSNPLDVVSNPLDVFSNPLDVVSNPLDVFSNPLDIVSNPLDVVSNPLYIVSNQINDEKEWNKQIGDQKKIQNWCNYIVSEQDSKYNLKSCSVVLTRLSAHELSKMQCYGSKEMGKIHCTQDVERSNHVIDFLETKAKNMPLRSLNFTAYECFLCNNGQDYSKIGTLIKHVVEDHCRTSETSADLCLSCSVENCWWQKPIRRPHAISAKGCIYDIKFAYSALFEHLVKYHDLPVPDYIKTIQCSHPQCRFKCFRMKNLNLHMATHAEKVCCESCGLYIKPTNISRHLKKCTPLKHIEPRRELHSSFSESTQHNSVEAHHVDARDQLHMETPRDNSMGACHEKLQMLDLSLKARRCNKYAETALQQLKLELKTKISHNYLNFLSYKCFLCNNEPDLKSYHQLCDHLFKEHCRQENNGEFIFLCPKVGCTWQKYTKKNWDFIKRYLCHLLKHLNIAHDMAVPTYVRQFQCKISNCKFGSVVLRQLTSHMVSHDKEKITCKCGKFLKAPCLKKHMKCCPIMRKQDGENSEEHVKKVVENRSGDNELNISRNDFEEPLISCHNPTEKRSDMQNDIFPFNPMLLRNHLQKFYLALPQKLHLLLLFKVSQTETLHLG